MLLRFTVENWMSFRDKTTFSMIASRERQYSGHLANVAEYNVKLLPAAAIYGGNASGKSNLIKALRFAQELVTNVSKPDDAIPVNPFRLSDRLSDQPTKFTFEILVEKSIYEYSFSVTRKRVLEESLKRHIKTTEKILFLRQADNPNPMLDKQQYTDELAQKLLFAFQGTNDNQLFLTNSVTQKLTVFKPVYDWFEKTLILIEPDSRYGRLHEITDDRNVLYKQMTSRLCALDSGISSIQQEEFPTEAIPKWILNNVPEGETITIRNPEDSSYIFLNKKSGNVVARSLASYHKSDEGQKISFRLSDESDGTQRLIDLLPAFIHLEENQHPFVIVIDELDRSLHSLLTENLIGNYLASRTGASRSQLIFTTHDVQLMDQSLFRRDEMWVTERDRNGASKLIAFSEYKDVRKDKDIRKSYLQAGSEEFQESANRALKRTLKKAKPANACN